MPSEIAIGQVGRLTSSVGSQQSIRLGTANDDGAIVLSTPAMINLMEHAAREALRPYLEPHEESVGVAIQVEHLAATPLGASVRAEAEVTGLDGRMIDFAVRAYDPAEPIGRGTHRRAIIRMDRFRERLADKNKTFFPGMLLPMNIEPNRSDPPAMETLNLRVEGPLAVVTLNRPRQANAVNVKMTGEWEQLVAWLAGHAEEVRVVIVTGSGDVFCAGDDVKEVRTLSPEAAESLSLRQARLYLSFEQLPQVLVAAVNGHALGGGCVCAYACDFRLATPAAQFGMPEILLGWPPGYGVAQLTALVGKARTLELCLTGRPISAHKAYEYGLIHEVIPPQRLMPAARELAEALLATPPIALRETKRLVHADEGERPKLTHLADTAAYIRCLATEDAREGIAAFVEKRKAVFRGR